MSTKSVSCCICSPDTSESRGEWRGGAGKFFLTSTPRPLGYTGDPRAGGGAGGGRGEREKWTYQIILVLYGT